MYEHWLFDSELGRAQAMLEDGVEVLDDVVDRGTDDTALLVLDDRDMGIRHAVDIESEEIDELAERVVNPVGVFDKHRGHSHLGVHVSQERFEEFAVSGTRGVFLTLLFDEKGVSSSSAGIAVA